MGKRKSSAKPQKRIQQKLSTTFSCLFCNHENSVTCTIDKKTGIGGLTCKVCGQTFQASINALSEPIDVYCEWVDACEAVAKSEKPSYSAEKSSLADNSRLDETEEYGDGPSKTGASDSEDGY